jgi:branched-chain amino acid aminotransferase
MPLQYPLTQNPEPKSDVEVAAVLADPGFGVHFSDHMATATWRDGAGWGDDGVVPYGPLALYPAAAVLHYAQEVFEGLKAYRHADGSVWLFRPLDNAERLNRSAARMMLPELPEQDFLAAVESLVRADARWVPQGSGERSLYLRPFMFASESFLGVRAAKEVRFLVVGSPSAPYLASGTEPVDIWVTSDYARAGIGGTGAAKCGGNYAASLIAQYQGYEHGCAQVLFIETSNRDRVEELGGMNLFLVSGDELVTPALTGTILDGITRRSVLAVAADLGLRVQERRVTPEELFDGIRDGSVQEAFACGTAAVISPVRTFKSLEGEFPLSRPAGERTLALRERLVDIQYGRAEDAHGWMRRVL